MAIGGSTRMTGAPDRVGAGTVISAPARDASEQIVARLRRSGRHLVWPAIWFILVCGGTGYFWHHLPEPWMNTALPIAAGVLVILLSLLPLVFWMNRIILITTRRLIMKRGFVVRERSEFLLGQGSEATLRRGPLQLLAGSGDVIVHAGAAGTMILRDVPRAKLVHRTVRDLIEHAVGQAGIRPTTRRPFVN